MAFIEAGSEMPCRCSMKLGQSRGAVGAFIDITERRRAAEALEAANLELRNFGNALTQAP